MTDVQDKAREAVDWFESATRGDTGKDEDRYIRTKDGTPEWVRDIVHAAHGSDFLPDDYRYKWTMEALEYIADADDPEDSSDFADQAVDEYTGARFAWLASNLQRASYVDDAIENLGRSDQGIIGDIGLGQYQEAGEVYGIVLDALERLS